MFSCTITCKVSQKDASNMMQLFDSEDQMRSDRATFRYELLTGGVNFTIKAKDAVALRATANTVMKTLAVYEKAKV